jgi:EAL domain-containing protein (putative c-di-GMP-specific phosphodiesterase class I)
VERTVSVRPFADAKESRFLRRLRDPLTLGYVRELPLDGVKLDRIFTRDLTISAGGWTLARSVIALLGQFDLEIIAEGLETAAHLAQLRSLGCHVGQGYYFARPGQASSLQFEDLGRVSA